ncbi:MAG: PAS domain-containing protein, partial [Aliifodinibius sp.]|nr:PAS domain-containing protein [Candidatus Saccharibacteria bacterium]NIT61579.1 PAS domain-containing protein [Fodinibius sp.]NIV16181.1 PAS domain-containing protein [Fodinibius sp.]NIY30159.1 PAS domain-containing protein [Fodinibius sp.]
NATLFHTTQEDRDRVTSIINSIQEGIVMLDSQGVIVLCNQQISAILGIGIREFVGTELISLPPRIYNALGIKDP